MAANDDDDAELKWFHINTMIGNTEEVQKKINNSTQMNDKHNDDNDFGFK